MYGLTQHVLAPERCNKANTRLKISTSRHDPGLCCLISLPYCNPSNDLSGAFLGLEVYLWPQEPLWFQVGLLLLPPDTWGDRFDGKYHSPSWRSKFLFEWPVCTRRCFLINTWELLQLVGCLKWRLNGRQFCATHQGLPGDSTGCSSRVPPNRDSLTKPYLASINLTELWIQIQAQWG